MSDKPRVHSSDDPNPQLRSQMPEFFGKLIQCFLRYLISRPDKHLNSFHKVAIEEGAEVQYLEPCRGARHRRALFTNVDGRYFPTLADSQHRRRADLNKTGDVSVRLHTLWIHFLQTVEIVLNRYVVCSFVAVEAHTRANTDFQQAKSCRRMAPQEGPSSLLKPFRGESLLGNDPGLAYIPVASE